MTTLTRVLVIIGVGVILLWHPVTRRIVFVILPLGRGVDDLLFWLLLAAFCMLVFVKGWISIPKIKQFFINLEKEENQNE